MRLSRCRQHTVSPAPKAETNTYRRPLIEQNPQTTLRLRQTFCSNSSSSARQVQASPACYITSFTINVSGISPALLAKTIHELTAFLCSSCCPRQLKTNQHTPSASNSQVDSSNSATRASSYNCGIPQVRNDSVRSQEVTIGALLRLCSFTTLQSAYSRLPCSSAHLHLLTPCTPADPPDRRSTFEPLSRWLTDARALASPDLVVVLVGNKTDRGEDEREVPYLEASKWANENGVLFLETSSLSGDNVEAPFALAARSILLAIESGKLDPEKAGSGVSYGDRALRRVGSGSRFSFADMDPSSLRPNRRGGAAIKIKEVFEGKMNGCC